jgi:Iron-binding zinc finger CDGSH type
VNDATITPSDNGPYLVQGNFTLLDAEGNPYEVNGTIALCRCGYSYTRALLRRLAREDEFRGGEQGKPKLSSNEASGRRQQMRLQARNLRSHSPDVAGSILPRYWKSPAKRGFSVLAAAIGRQNFCPTFALTDAMHAYSRGSCELLQARARLLIPAT